MAISKARAERTGREKRMENIINKLSEIEAIASRIMDAVEERNQEIAEQKEAERKAFDARLEEETNQKLEEIRRKLEEKKSQELERLQADVEKASRQMEQDFENGQEQIAQEICQRILRM